jgi:hypothetical protein
MAFTKITAAGIGSTETVTLDGVAVINNESIGGNLTVTGNATIGGVLTYEDVTNVDSVGLITARNGIVVGSGVTLSKDGDIFATGVTTTGSISATTGTFSADTSLSIADKIVHTGDTNTAMRFFGDNIIRLDTDGADRLRVEQAGNVDIAQNLNVSGVVTATSFSGSVAASQLTGALPAISGANLTGLAAGGAFIKGVVGVTTLTPVGIETSTVTRKDLIGPAGNTSTGAGSSFHGAYMGDGFLSFNTEFSSSSGYYISTFTNALVAGPMQLGSTLTIDGNFTIV